MGVENLNDIVSTKIPKHMSGDKISHELKSFKESSDLQLRIITLGDQAVGKTSFLHTLRTGHFTPVRGGDQGALSHVSKTYRCMERDVMLEIYDTGGQERFRSLTTSYYRNAHGCLLFFNVHSRQTFDHVEQWMEEIDTHKKRLPLVLVGLVHRPVREDFPPWPRAGSWIRQINIMGRKDSSDKVQKQLKRQKSDISSVSSNSSETPTRYRSSSAVSSQTRTDIPGVMDSPLERQVPQAQAEHLAARHCVPYREVDLTNTASLQAVMDTLLTVIVMNINRRGSLEHYIRPPSRGTVHIMAPLLQERGCCVVRYIKNIL